jgi:Zn-dependent protease
MHDDYLGDTSAAWQAHRQRVLQAGQPVVNDAAAFDQVSRAATEQLIVDLERDGRLVRRDGAAHVTWRHALAFAWQLYRGQRRVAQVRKRRGSNAGLDAQGTEATSASGMHADIHAFEQQLGLSRATPASTRRKWGIFLVSAMLFLAVGGLWMEWTFVPVLLAVIALHEGGHYLAMKLAGYRNLSVFFLPGLGGLATGEKASATPWEKLVVYLAGPLPGLLLALAGLAAMASGGWQPPPWFLQFLVACLVVNYLNLLPITPLDGGRVVETFLFARLPAARLVFALLGFAALVAFGLAADDTVTLAIAAFIALTLPHQWRVMRVDRAIDRRGDEVLDERGAIERVFAALQRPQFARWPFPTRVAAAMSLLAELQGRRPRAGEAVAGMAIYALLLAAPIVAAVVAFPAQSGAISQSLASSLRLGGGAVHTRNEVDWYAQAERVQALPEAERLPILLRAADQAAENEDRERESKYLAAAWTLAEKRPPRDADRTRTLMARARSSEDPAVEAGLLRQVVAEHEGGQEPEDLIVLAEAREMQAWAAESPERIALLRAAVQHREQADDRGWNTAWTRQRLALELDEAGDAAAAEVLLRRNVDTAPAPRTQQNTCGAPGSQTARLEGQIQLGWFLVAHDRAPEATALVQPVLERQPQEKVRGRWDPQLQLRELNAWALLQYASPEQIRGGWERYEAAMGTLPDERGSRLLTDLDRFVLAQGAQDQTAAQKAREASLKTAGSTQAKGLHHRLCGTSPSVNGYELDWRDKQWQARAQAARTLGVCSGREPART